MSGEDRLKGDAVVKKKLTYFRFCKRCDEKFKPTGKFQRFCGVCKKNN